MPEKLSSRFRFRISTGWWAAIFFGLASLSGAINGWAEEKIFLPVIIRTGSGPVLSGCPVFPVDHIWNAAIDHLLTDPLSDVFVTTIGLTKGVHADFGSGTWEGGPIGIPFIVVPGSQSKVTVAFDYQEESDPGPYPIPLNPPIEGGAAGQGDRHVLILDRDHCRLYELYNAWPQPDGSWQAGSGAQFNLNSYELRPETWTSADAAGLAILPGKSGMPSALRHRPHDRNISGPPGITPLGIPNSSIPPWASVFASRPVLISRVFHPKCR